MSAVVGLLLAHVFLLREVGAAIERLLAGAAPLPDLRQFVEGLTLVRLGATSVAVLAGCVLAYSWSLRSRFQLNAIFLALPLAVAAVGLAFHPIALHFGRARVRAAYDRGVELFTRKQFGQCLGFFNEFHRITSSSFIGDNALGRVAGCKYHLGDFEGCLRTCAEQLEQYPDSDIREAIRLTARMAMQRLGRSADVAHCAALHESLGLARWELSPLLFCLDADTIERRTRLADFGVFSVERARVVEASLASHGQDPLGAKAAYRAGLRSHLEGPLSSTREGRLYSILRGDELAQLQRWSEALALYRSYLDAEPNGDLRATVHLRVVRAIFGRHEDLDSTLSAVVTTLGEHFDHGPQCRDLIVGRMCYEPDRAALLDAYAKWSPRMSVELRAHLAAALAERLELEGESLAAARLAADAHKQLASAQSSGDVELPLSLSWPTLDAGMAEYCNTRLVAAPSARLLWDALEFGAREQEDTIDAGERLAREVRNSSQRTTRFEWMHAFDAHHQDALAIVRPVGAPSFTERLSRRLEVVLAKRASELDDPYGAILLLADLRPARARGKRSLRIVWPINNVIEYSVRRLEEASWERATPDESLSAAISLLRVRDRVAPRSRIDKIGARALEQCAAALRDGAVFEQPSVAAGHALRAATGWGRSAAQTAIADHVLAQVAELAGSKLDSYVETTEKLWPFSTPEVLTRTQLGVYSNATRADRALSLRYVDQCFHAAETLRESPCVELLVEDLRALGIDQAPPEANRILCDRVIERVRSSSLRTSTTRRLAPWLYDQLERVAEVSGDQSVRRSLRSLALLGLGDARNFDLCNTLFERYRARFPQDPFTENGAAWIAWLWCFEANAHLGSADVYLRSYRRAAAEFAELAAHGQQPRIRLNAQRALHIVRRKIAEVASGEQTPHAYSPIAEFGRFEGQHGCLWEHELSLALQRGQQRSPVMLGAPVEASASSHRGHSSPVARAASAGLCALDVLVRLTLDCCLPTRARPPSPSKR